MPQIVMLGHASSVNYKRSGLGDSSKDTKLEHRGKDTSEMTTEEYKRYFLT